MKVASSWMFTRPVVGCVVSACLSGGGMTREAAFGKLHGLLGAGLETLKCGAS